MPVTCCTMAESIKVHMESYLNLFPGSATGLASQVETQSSATLRISQSGTMPEAIINTSRTVIWAKLSPMLSGSFSGKKPATRSVSRSLFSSMANPIAIETNVLLAL